MTVHAIGGARICMRLPSGYVYVNRSDLRAVLGGAVCDAPIVDRHRAIVGRVWPAPDGSRLFVDLAHGSRWFLWWRDVAALAHAAVSVTVLHQVYGTTTAPATGNAGPLHA